MAYVGTDGRTHVSAEESSNGQYDGGFVVIDNPYPDPKFFQGAQPMPIDPDTQAALNAINQRIADQTEGLRRVTEGKYNGPDGSAAMVLAIEGKNPPDPITPQPDFK